MSLIGFKDIKGFNVFGLDEIASPQSPKNTRKQNRRGISRLAKKAAPQFTFRK